MKSKTWLDLLVGFLLFLLMLALSMSYLWAVREQFPDCLDLKTGLDKPVCWLLWR